MKPDDISHTSPSPNLQEVAKQVSALTEQTDDDTGSPFANRRLPPLHKWQPTTDTHMDLTIKSNGQWWHEGSVIPRASMIELFSSVLVCDDGASDAKRYYFKTPAQKIFITVEDAPLLVTTVEQREHDGQKWIVFITNTQDIAPLNDKHVPYFREYQGQMRPYVMIRDGLEALISRNAYYHLIDMGELTQNPDGSINDSVQTQLHLNSGSQEYVLSHVKD